MPGNESLRTKHEDVLQLLKANRTLEHAQQVADLVANNLTRFARARQPARADRLLAQARDVAHQVFAEHMDSLEATLAELYDRHFSHDEIRGMLAFYDSELGRKSLRVMPVLVQSSIQGMQAWAQALVPQIRERMRVREPEAALDAQ
jgi:hypothetical protein